MEENNLKKFKIYKHTSPSGKVYIGQTQAENVIQRWRNGGKGYFRTNPKTGEYQQPAMINAINKYPWNDWEHEIIDQCDTLEEADKLEEYYIALYKSNDPKYGYNITKGGKGHNGQPMSDITKTKLSIAIKELWEDQEYRQKVIDGRKGIPMHENTRKALLEANTGRKQTDETKYKLKIAHANPILQFTLSGEFIKEYINASDVLKEISSIKSVTSITNNCKGKSKKCNNFLFLYKSDYESNPQLLQERLQNLNSRKKSAKPILQFTVEGNFIKEYPSITDASLETGIKFTSISNCVSGYSKTSGGFVWKYK